MQVRNGQFLSLQAQVAFACVAMRAKKNGQNENNRVLKGAKNPELILWVIITMLLVKLAVVLFNK